MPTTSEVVKAIYDDAWAALRVTTIRVSGVDDLLRDPEACDLIDTGIAYSTGATLAYLRSRGWLNEDKMSAEVSDG